LAGEQTELFIALVAAVGTDVGMVATELETELREYGVESHGLRLSEYLADLPGVEDFRDKPFDERLWEAMSAGDKLREDWDRDDALALWAISEIFAERAERVVATVTGPDDEELPANLDRFAFILRSLKTPDELETLRAIYGERLVVIAAYSPDDERLAQLTGEIRASRRENDQRLWAHTPQELIDRDMKEEAQGGQNVSDTFHRADFFIRAWDTDVARRDIERTLEILFGHPYRTPTRDEHGQFMAAGAARRSAEPGRQVGAAIATPDGSIISVGTNEVPKYRGGSHWEEDGVGNREFEIAQRDTNRLHQERIAAQLADSLDGYFHDVLTGEELEDAKRKALAARIKADLPNQLLKGGLKEITEFGRATHAEMNALLDAARRGVPVQDATVYTTTFPCHNCARHIVGAGIARVVFVEPYPKSKARDLHEDSIAIGVADGGDAVAFKPFVGVAPRRYLSVFDAAARETLAGQPRKNGEGAIRNFVKAEAVPLFPDLEHPAHLRPLLPAYRSKEFIALKHFAKHSGVAEDDDQADVERQDVPTTNDKEKSNG
jgi:deoxycytidylate deaminase